MSRTAEYTGKCLSGYIVLALHLPKMHDEGYLNAYDARDVTGVIRIEDFECLNVID